MHVWQFSWQNCAGLSTNCGMFYLACLSSLTFPARVQCWPSHSELVTISICQVIWIKHNMHIFWPADSLASSLEDTTIWCNLSNPQLLEVLKMLQTLDWEIQNVSDCGQLWNLTRCLMSIPNPLPSDWLLATPACLQGSPETKSFPGATEHDILNSFL